MELNAMNIPNQCVPDNRINRCCVIGCGQPAKFLVRPKVPSTYEDYTHACADHVEDLKEAEDDVVENL